MKTKVKFKYMTHQGQLKSKLFEFDHPEFEDEIISDLFGRKINPAIVHSKEKKIVSFLDDFDKRDFMEENEMLTILNYWIPEKKEPKESFVDYLKARVSDEDMLLTLLHISKEIKDQIKSFDNHKKFDFLLSHYRIAIKGATEAYRNVNEMLTSSNKEESSGNELFRLISQD